MPSQAFDRWCRSPEVLAAINPFYAIRFLAIHGWDTLIILGGVFLVTTGAEALYADLGHFGRKPIALAWYWVVFPALLLNYLGQGALVLRDPTARENPFFHMVPGWMLWPFIALATVAAVIASQALISGAFSLTMQSVQMGYTPFINIRHTSHEEHGQIYIPQINALLAVGCIALVLIFRSSDALASAYGIAVTLTMIATTLLLYFAVRRVWKWSAVHATALCAPFLGIELAFLAANSTKIAEGGWMPLAIGGIVFLMMTTWKKGRHQLRKCFPETLSLREFVASTASSHGRHSAVPARVPGTAVFLAGQPRGTPGSLLHNLKHNKVLHERNVILTIRTDRIPYVSKLSRIEITRSLPRILSRCRPLRLYGNSDAQRSDRMLRSEEFHDRRGKNELFPGTRNSRLHQQTRNGPLAQIALLCHEPSSPNVRPNFSSFPSTEQSSWDSAWNFDATYRCALITEFLLLFIL